MTQLRNTKEILYRGEIEVVYRTLNSEHMIV